MAEDLKLRVITDGDTRGLDKTARALDGLADDADRAHESIYVMGKGADDAAKKTEGLGDKSKKTSHDVQTLDGKISQLKTSLKALAADLEKDVGNTSLLKKFRSDSRELSGLERMRKQIGGLTGDVASLGKEAGQTASTFSSLFQGGAISALMSPAGAAVAAPFAAGAVINAGALAGGALTAGVGLGVAGAGIAGAAAQSQAVRNEWARTTADIKNNFLDATTSFEQPTIAAIRRIGGAVRDIHMDKIFGDAAKFVEPLAESGSKAIGAVGRGVEALVTKGGPAIRATGVAVEAIATGVEHAMEKIAGGSEGGAKAIADLGSAIGDTVEDIGTFIRWTENAYDALDDLRRKASEVHPFIGALYDIKGTDKVSELGTTTLGLSIAAGTAADSYYTLDQRIAMANQRMQDQIAAIHDLEGAFDDAKGKILSLSEANINAAENVAQLKQSFEENGKTLDINTEKGRNNLRAINDTVDGYIRQRDAAIAAGGGTEEAYNKARAAYNNQIQALEDLLVKLGLSRAAAHQLMDAFYDKTVTVTVKVHQVGDVTREGVILSGDMRRNAGQAYASGTSSAARGWALVGEDGPELVNFAGGERVHSTAETSAILTGAGGLASAGSGGAGGGQPIVINLIAEGQLLRTVLINAAENRGQSVSQYLGV